MEPGQGQADEQEHEELVAAELARMQAGEGATQELPRRSATDQTVELQRPPKRSR